MKNFMRKTCVSILILFSVASANSGQLIDKTNSGYLVSLPYKDRGERNYPVLVSLPGWGVKSRLDRNFWVFGAEKKWFILINMDVDYEKMKSPQDFEGLFQRIIDAIGDLQKEDIPVDPNKIFLVGTSAGGMMTISLAFRHPERFVAFGVMSGADFRFDSYTNIEKAKGLYFYLAHGEKDEIVGIDKFFMTKQELEKNGAIISSQVYENGKHTLDSSAYRKVLGEMTQLQ